jgi:thiol:disulfide interchange protein DsbC
MAVFFIYGDIYKINTNSITNITDLDVNKRRSEILKDLHSHKLISFKAEKEQYSVVVFTDVDCGYCRKLHKK